MRTVPILAAAGLALLFIVPQTGQAGVDIGLSVDRDGIKGFYLAVGDHYQVVEKEVVAVRKRTVSDEELAVVFFLAEHAEVSPRMILDLRAKGKSWWGIAIHFNLSPNIFFVQLERDPGPPYGKAYGHYKNGKKKKWREVKLGDEEIINLVNLRFVSERYGWSPDEVISLRQKGKSFVEINDTVKTKAKANRDKKQVSKAEPDSKKDKGKGKKKK